MPCRLMTIPALAVASLGLGAGVAQARATLRVHSTVTQHGSAVQAGFDFAGSEVSGFQLVMPRGAELATRSFTGVGRLIRLVDVREHRMHYELMQTAGESLTLSLDDVAARFSVDFDTRLLRFSRTEAALIRARRVTSVVLAFTFTGSANQYATARIRVRV